MDVRQKIQPAQLRRALSVKFNDDKEFFAIGLETGFWILQTADAKPVVKKNLKSGIGMAQMMGSTNVIALVGGGIRPMKEGHRVIVWDESKQKDSWEIQTKAPIRAVNIRSGNVFIALQNSLQVYSLSTRKLGPTYQTADNLCGILCVSDKLVAFPGRVAGQIQIVEVATGDVSMILGHDAPLRALSFSQDGEMLASASEKGTMIHIYNTRNCATICEVRRGMDQAHVFDLCFSPSGALLASTSDKGTLHIFDIPRPGRNLPDTAAPSITATGPLYSGSRPSSSNSNSSAAATRAKDLGTSNGWGWLGKVPLLPKAFSDRYSFASAKFDLGEEPEVAPEAAKAQKGAIGWYTEDDLVVVGAGYDAKWEKFRMAEQDSGKRFVARIGWKRYYDENQ
ncbi:unnamed protein product [Discula destructiva]